MIQNNKILLIGLPRCGSTYVADLISKNFYYKNLAEPFTPNQNYTIGFIDNNICLVPPIKFSNIKEQNDHVFSVLNTLDKKDRIILKYFPRTEDSSFTNKYIVTKLINNGFVPIVLKRINIEYHLLSFLCSTTSNIWQSNDINFKREKIEIKKFSVLYWFTKSYEEYIKLVKNINPIPNVIEYETAKNDIINLFSGENLKMITQVYKLSSQNPYDDIINACEVKPVVDGYVNVIKNIIKKYDN
jgi:hypothetical protein